MTPGNRGPSLNSKPLERIHRARSVPSPRPFRIAALLYAIHLLCIVMVLTIVLCMAIKPNPAASRFLVWGMAAVATSWLIAYFKRRTTRCPLCKGTPYLNTGALVHKRATRIPPLNHGISATLSTLATQRFRCMFCGSDYDLLKPPSHQLDKQQDP